jgi:membrane-associated protease RseP (regulator of RpoE activity)
VAISGDMIFGTPIALRALELLFLPGVPAEDIMLHPVAFAGLVGLLATALNLLPMGQLDGGHILYAFVGDRTKLVTRISVVALIPMGIYFMTPSWLLWAGLIFFFGMRHPSIVDPRPLGMKRVCLGVVALVVLILSFTPSPVRPSNLDENARRTLPESSAAIRPQ